MRLFPRSASASDTAALAELRSFSPRRANFHLALDSCQFLFPQREERVPSCWDRTLFASSGT